MKAAVVIEKWKLPIFSKRLTEAGFHYEEAGSLPGDSLNLIVVTTRVQALAQVVLAANKEAAKSKERK